MTQNNIELWAGRGKKKRKKALSQTTVHDGKTSSPARGKRS